MHVDKMQWFLWDEFDTWMSECTISPGRWLKRVDIRGERIGFLTTKHNQFLRDDWICSPVEALPDNDFFDEFAMNELTKDRNYGWAPIGVRPTEHRPHKRSERAYSSSIY